MAGDWIGDGTDARARDLLMTAFQAAVASAAPGEAVRRHLPAKPKGRCIVIGAGKASAVMAAAVDTAWADVDLTGVVVTRYGHGVPAGRIEIIEASHPRPDANSALAAERILDAVGGLGPDDLVLALISGGGSALMCLPPAPMTLADKVALNQALLHSGATITDMNAVRKHFSLIKGGRLAQAAHPAQVVTLLISDVPGDDPGVIASGPTVVDSSTWDDVDELLARYEIALPEAARVVRERREETPKAGAFASDVRIIAAPSMALAAAAEVARAAGVRPLILGDAIEGEAREVGIMMAGIARSVRQHGAPARAPALLLSGGEATVTIGKGGAGRGGRNTEFLLGLAVALGGAEGVWALACDSDGIDGTEDAAGAIVAPDTLARGRALGHQARAYLSAHDSYSYFKATNDLVVTGPTLTNVNDIRAILIV